ncbi:hypothetical protein VNI00_004714 [Paramarasmius palmivorus]|uniref:Pectinesterase n=1 Tax=Paramarasmius palmivorus TaxID=297713 RepID=A0AAW0DEW7_9AGAR
MPRIFPGPAAMAKATFLLVVFLQFFLLTTTYGASIAKRNSPPAGALIVKPKGDKNKGEFSKIQDAVDSLPKDGSSQVIYIYAGTYKEQVSISSGGPLTIIGQTSDSSIYSGNTVTITHSSSQGQTGNDDATGTLRVHRDNFKLYNINLKNTFGQASSGGQALALSAYGKNQGFYGVAMYSYQDTVLVNTGSQFFGKCYIEGAVDYIFGQHARSFFHKCKLSSIGAGSITAHGPSASDNSIRKGDLTGKVYLGRPWSEYAHVGYTSCTLGDLINGAGWSQWQNGDPRTGHVQFVEYQSSGAGASGTRAIGKRVNNNAGYTIDDVLGGSWQQWVDTSYY